jgi:hypothetical protein
MIQETVVSESCEQVGVAAPLANRSVARLVVLRRAAREVVGVHLPMLVFALVYMLAGSLVWDSFSLGVSLGLWVSYPKLLTLFSLLSVVLLASYGTWVLRPPFYTGPLFAVRPWAQLVRGQLSLRCLLEIALLLAVIPPFMDAFRQWKVVLPLLHPFGLDAEFHWLDQALHFGYMPWEFTHALPLSGPVALSIMDALYHPAWHLVLFLVICGCLWMRDARVKQQFFLSYVLVWSLLGTVAATLLSSVGPCYYEKVTGDAAPYAPLLTLLRGAHELRPLGAVTAQDGLWSAYESGDYMVQVGISAMPSLHVAVAVLIALFAWQVHRIFGWLAIVYAAIILFGSVHLGWHYAVDGYFSIVATLLIWWGAGRFLCWYNGSLLPERTDNRGKPAFVRPGKV